MKKLLLLVGFVFMGSSLVTAQAQTAQPPHNMPERAAYSLFVSKYRNKNYTGALNYGRWILLSMPKTIKNYSSFDLATSLDRFVTIYANLAKNTSDKKLKTAYIDTVQNIFSKTFKQFSKDEIDLFSWKLRQGRILQDFADVAGENAKKKSLEAYKKAFALNPEKMTTSYEGYYLKVMLRSLADQKTDAAQKKAVAVMKKAGQYANESMTKYFDEIRGQLFDKPKERIAYLESQLEKNPENAQAMKQLRNLYVNQGKTKKAQKLNEKLYKVNPSYQNIVSLAKFEMSHANYQQAIKYYKEAANKTDETSKLKTIYYKLASAYMNLNEYQQAASYTQKAINAAPDWGRAYLQMATVYARTVNNCVGGGELSVEDRAVYWLVVDYVQKAKRVDPKAESRANTLLSNYRPVTPSKGKMFFKGWKEGDTISIDSSLDPCYGWINETTTARQ